MIEGQRERELWLRVIREAQIVCETGSDEVVSDEDDTPLPNATYLARRWLTTDSLSFRLVASMAGLEPDQGRALQERMRVEWLND